MDCFRARQSQPWHSNELNAGVVIEYGGNFLAKVEIGVSTPSTPKLFGSLWGKDDPILFFPPVSLGEPPRTMHFDQLTDADWEYLVPCRQEFQVSQFVHFRGMLSLIGIVRIMSQLWQISSHLLGDHASYLTKKIWVA